MLEGCLMITQLVPSFHLFKKFCIEYYKVFHFQICFYVIFNINFGIKRVDQIAAIKSLQCFSVVQERCM